MFGATVRSDMPSQLHESLIELFRNPPELAAMLAQEALGVSLPPFAEARIESANLTDVQPAEYRADLVVLLYNGKPVFGIVVEVQLSQSKEKLLTWPVYATTLRARMNCPVGLLVVAADESARAHRPADSRLHSRDNDGGGLRRLKGSARSTT